MGRIAQNMSYSQSLHKPTAQQDMRFGAWHEKRKSQEEEETPDAEHEQSAGTNGQGYVSGAKKSYHPEGRKLRIW